MKQIPYKIYVMLGFHTSFYHSWRGDTPDEAGFGVDIRVVREILRLLNEANANGLQARGYWDIDVYWTIEKIIQPYAPDILDAIRRRVDSRLDDIVLGSYNNGANHAATRRELQTALEYARSNPDHTGLEQLFSVVFPLMRPQECMMSSGQNTIYQQAGIQGVVLYYASVPFNTFGAFIPALPTQQRYNLIRLRSTPEDAPIEVWPCISQLDLFENTCLEALLLKLRQYQLNGQVESDLLVHINFDADADLWLPMKLPVWLKWFPNLGGLREYIQVVNRYPWASFTIPSEYRPQHPPQADLLVRQDLADGGFDGNYSWAEKFSSLQNWTLLEQSRLYTYQAEALLDHLQADLAQRMRAALWEGRDSAFFRRLVGLSTTHFGMSTPVINSERQAVASALLGEARSMAGIVFYEAASAIRLNARQTQPEALYQFEVSASTYQDGNMNELQRAIIRIPLLLPPGVRGVRLYDESDLPIKTSWINTEAFLSGWTSGELLFWTTLLPGKARRFSLRVNPELMPKSEPLERLQNPWLDLKLADGVGIRSLMVQGRKIGDENFLQPMITTRSHSKQVSWKCQGFQIAALPDERWDGLQRTKLHGCIPMKIESRVLYSDFSYTFTVFEDLPCLLVDVEVKYARTPARDVIENAQQRLRRLIDLRWIETAPFQLRPKLLAQSQIRTLRVWKHNALGITTFYDLDYGKVNPRNRNLDSFNHQVTHGWVAVSNGELGLLLAESATVLASMAFCPMRLQESAGFQQIWLNPFGSYFGRQLDYTHMGGNGAGARLTAAASSAQRPNGPSFNGQRLSFSLLLTPYLGDAPDPQLQADAMAFFYPPAVVLLQTPEGIQATTPDELKKLILAERTSQNTPIPLPVPFNLLASPAEQAVDLTWESDPVDYPVKYQVRWRAANQQDWAAQEVAQGVHLRLEGLETRRHYVFQVRAIGQGNTSDWSEPASARTGRIRAKSMVALGRSVPLTALARLIWDSLWHALRVAMTRPWKE